VVGIRATTPVGEPRSFRIDTVVQPGLDRAAAPAIGATGLQTPDYHRDYGYREDHGQPAHGVHQRSDIGPSTKCCQFVAGKPLRFAPSVRNRAKIFQSIDDPATLLDRL